MIKIVIDLDFEKDCMKERTKTFKPSVEFLKTPVEIEREVSRFRRGSEYFLEGCKRLAGSRTPLLAIILGYFTMEHKASEILAKKGY